MNGLNRKWHGILCLGIVGLAYLLAMSSDFSTTNQQRQSQLSPLQERIARYFVAKGIADPVNKAVVLTRNSRYPKVAAAQAVVESRVNPKAIGKRREKGAYQVIEKHWGKVADRLELQTKQHSNILSDLLEENHGSLYRAVKSYNGVGKSSIKYADAVLKNMAEIGMAQ